ncbi:conserved hypothetical protein [Xanthomonas citri pv. fuscans]|nr:conserved hypothetical protein [Xanthomonas citri pv. fuscans]
MRPTPRPTRSKHLLDMDPTSRRHCITVAREVNLTPLLVTPLLQQQRALGHDAFRAMVEAKTNRFAGVRPAHRPRRPNSAD